MVVAPASMAAWVICGQELRFRAGGVLGAELHVAHESASAPHALDGEAQDFARGLS